MKLLRELVLLLIGFLCLSVFQAAYFPFVVAAQTITVPDDYPTIQAAVNAANEKDTITVRSGIYNEHVIVNKTVTLSGEDKETTIIDANYSDCPVRITASSANITHFTLRNSDPHFLWGAGVYIDVDATNCTVSDNIIHDTNNGVLLFKWQSQPGVGLHVVSNNSISNAGEGIMVEYSSSNVLVGNIFFHCGDGIKCLGGSNNTISNNNVSSCSMGILAHSDFNIISGNFLTDNYYESIYIDHSYFNVISGNRFNDTVGQSVSIMLNTCFFSNVSENTILRSKTYLDMGQSANNTIFNNNFLQGQPLLVSNPRNSWNLTYPISGNYYWNYDGTDLYRGSHQNETGSDGIGDTPFAFDGNDTDYYPLMKPFSEVPDVGIKVGLSKTIVPEGYNRIITMYIAIINYGVQVEACNVTCQAGSELDQTLVLMPRNSTLCTVQLNVSGWTKGNYTLHSEVSPVPGETDTSDNNYTGTFTVSILGDVNGDGNVDMKDVGYVARRFLCKLGDSMWDPNADVNDDAKIDMIDIGTVARHFGGHYP